MTSACHMPKGNLSGTVEREKQSRIKITWVISVVIIFFFSVSFTLLYRLSILCHIDAFNDTLKILTLSKW